MNRIRALIFPIFLLLFAQTLMAQQHFCPEKLKAVIQAISSDDPVKIAEYVRFPLTRKYPLPPITNSKEFVRNYREIFDRTLVDRIASSHVETDWSVVGWHGLRLEDGTISLDSDFDYKITDINYQTEQAKKHWEDLVSRQRLSLPEELREFDTPTLDFATETHRIRVDQVGESFRLVRFGLATPLTYDLVLQDGEVSYDGNMGDVHWDWNYQGKIFQVQTWTSEKSRHYILEIFESSEQEEQKF